MEASARLVTVLCHFGNHPGNSLSQLARLKDQSVAASRPLLRTIVDIEPWTCHRVFTPLALASRRSNGMNAVIGLGVLAVVATAALGFFSASNGHELQRTHAEFKVAPEAAHVALTELVEPHGGALRLSQKARGLEQHRVRLVGYMAKLELPPLGGFYLTAQPVNGDESGAGTGDLPLDAVLVLAPSAGSKPLPTLEGPVEVTGLLELGLREDSEGRANWIRLHLEPAEPQ